MVLGSFQEPRLKDWLDVVRSVFDTTSRTLKGNERGQNARLLTPEAVRSETTKSSLDSLNQIRPKLYVRFAATVKDGNKPRPRSANRANEEAIPTKTGLYPVPRSKTDKDRPQPALKKPSIIPKRVKNALPLTATRVIKSNNDGASVTRAKTLSPSSPKEIVSSKLKQNEPNRAIPDVPQNKGDSSQTNPKLLKKQYQENIQQFEKLRTELDGHQKQLVDLYGKLQQSHGQLSAQGQAAALPAKDALRVLNVPDVPVLPPEHVDRAPARDSDNSKSILTLDIDKLNSLPNNLISNCEQTLKKREEIISWLDSLVKSGSKGIRINNLVGKVNEFTVENEMLNCSLEKVKAEFLQELREVLHCFRKGVNETMQLHVHNEELTYKLAELDEKNTNLRKQLHECEKVKSYSNRGKIEDLEKAFQEEKCKKAILQDRLKRAEGQVKMGNERAKQLEASLDESRASAKELAARVQQLNDQNQRLQSDFDAELKKLTKSIQENTINLDEIAGNREALEIEKNELENRHRLLYDHYTESMKNMRADLNTTTAKVIEAEKKYNSEIIERKKAEAKEESLLNELRDIQSRYTTLRKHVEETDKEIIASKALQEELEAYKKNMDKIKQEMEEYKEKLTADSLLIHQLEQNNKELLNDKENLTSELSTKEDQITNLELKQLLLKEQLQDNQNKMEVCENQLDSFRSHINELQNDFGKLENLNELRQTVNEQREKLIEAKLQIQEQAEAIQKHERALRSKEVELEQQSKLFMKQEEITRQNAELVEALQNKNQLIHNKDLELEQQCRLSIKHEEIIKNLLEKEKEHTDIIKMLKYNLEMKDQMEDELNQKSNKSQKELESLMSKLENKNEKITQLEKIILSYEEQTRKHRKNVIEESYSEHETIDNIIKILEDELQSPYDSKIADQSKDIMLSHKKYLGDYNKNVKLENFTCNETNTIPSRDSKVPTKIVMGNFVEKTYNISSKSDRKRAITDINDTRKWTPSPAETEYQAFQAETSLKRNPGLLNKNFPNFTSVRDERKYSKMFKLTGHRM